jgi:putative DNA primase/helicase
MSNCTGSNLHACAADISAALSLLIPTGAAFEIRVLGAGGVSHHKLSTFATVDDVARGHIVNRIAEESLTADGVYLTPHGGQNHDLIKSWCSLRPIIKGSGHLVTHDEDVPERRFLIVDVDPVRAVAGEMATEEEKGEAYRTMQTLTPFMLWRGWSDPLVVDSGNGYHLYYRLANPQPGGSADSSTDPIAVVLKLLNAKFGTPGANIDTNVFNAARLMRIPGTVTRKGSGQGERPHRVSKIVSMPDWSGPPRATDLGELIQALDPSGELRAKLITPKSAATPAAAVIPRATLANHDVMRRAKAYLAKIPGAVQGANGSSVTYGAATAMVYGFDLSTEDALSLLMSDYNPRCSPPWSEAELRHKVEDADKKQHHGARGHLLNEGRESMSCESPAAPPGGPTPGVAAPKPSEPIGEVTNPHRLAALMLREPSNDHLRSYQGDFVQWREGSYHSLTSEDIRAKLTKWTAREFERCYRAALANYANSEDEGCTRPKLADVTMTVVGNTLNAIKGETHIESTVSAPAWIDGATGPEPKSIIACRNGLFDINSGTLLQHDPRFFTFSAAPFDYDPNSPTPLEWLKFLSDVFPGDQQSIDCLQEWFGYLLTPDTRLQKMLFIVGPRRSGKGTMARVLKALVGERNHCGPPINSLATDFGMAPLIGKPLALIEDARLSGRADAEALTENLLSISGEGSVTINRKHREAVTVKLPTRFVIISNELPKIKDTSGALAGRMIVLSIKVNFYDKEDIGLAERLLAELPSILLWAIAGWKRLHARGRFLQPEAGASELAELENLGSPVGAFIRERCVIGPTHRVDTKELFAEWKRWCEESGRDHPGNAQVFGRDLKTCISTLETKEVRQNYDKFRVFIGIRLRQETDPDCPAMSHSVPRDSLLHAYETQEQNSKEEDYDTHNKLSRGTLRDIAGHKPEEI